MSAIKALFLLLLFSLGAEAQNNTVASGKDASGAGGSVSYSVGQIVYTTNTSTSFSSAQGVQQPYEISVITQTLENPQINISYSVYPNPTSTFLTLNIGTSFPQNLYYELYTAEGKLLEKKKIESNETILALEKYPKATYFIRVFDNTSELKSFKIIKN